MDVAGVDGVGAGAELRLPVHDHHGGIEAEGGGGDRGGDGWKH